MRPAHETGFSRFLQSGKSRIIGKPVRVPALHKSGDELDIELTLSAYELGAGDRFFVGALRDLRERVELERQLDANKRITAQYELMRALSESLTFEDAGPRILETLAKSLDFAVALLWVPVGVTPILRSSARFGEQRFEPFLRVSQELSLEPGAGLPGRVWRSGEPAWIRDVNEDTNFVRRQYANELGLRGGFAFPVVVQQRVTAVVELFSLEPRDPDEELMRTAKSIGGNIGQFIQRLRAEDEREHLLAELQRAVKTRDEFLSVASHELKTPLTPLLLKLESLERQLPRYGPSELADAVQAAIDTGRRQVSRLNELISDLLDVSRIDTGRLTIHLAPTDLSALVAEIVQRHEEHAKSLGSRLRLEAEPGIQGNFDRGRLEQVIVNLLDNAIKYGRGRDVEIRLSSNGHHAVLSVKDYGIGVPPEAMDRIFERFERAVSERHYGGLGLGLYITRTLVEAMHGSISVESEAGRGATFRVALPLH